ncbi:hypothetical protein JZ751_029572, partial [Albula glossodonta]
GAGLVAEHRGNLADRPACSSRLLLPSASGESSCVQLRSEENSDHSSGGDVIWYVFHGTNKDIEEEEGEMKAASALVLVFLLVSVAAMTIEKRLKEFFPQACNKWGYTSWYRVGSYCSNCARQAPGGHLVSLHSEQENSAVLSIIMKYSASSPRTWMGGLQIPSTKTYIWTDGSPWNYDAWVPGEPSHGKQEHCLEMNWSEHGKWNDLACWKKLGYMCAFKLRAATEGGGQE